MIFSTSPKLKRANWTSTRFHSFLAECNRKDNEAARRSKRLRKGLDLICDIHPDVPKEITADANRLSQVIINLVGNAIKFTQAGKVELQVALDRVEDNCACIHFSVRDTGIGIPH